MTMPKGKLARAHFTAGMRAWTDLEIEAVYYSLEAPHLLRPSHQAAMKRVSKKFINERRRRCDD
jgi:hypothetical protein